MISIDWARRKARGGKGVIPPNKTQWENEQVALDVRDDLSLSPHDPLPPVPQVFGTFLSNVTIIPVSQVPAAAVHLAHFTGDGAGRWSGLALPMGDGAVWVVFNDAHAPSRNRVTLMEEFFHLYLGHPCTVVRVLHDEDGAGRTYDSAVESEAYGCAAAALVPYAGLKVMVDSGDSVARIADHFGVSRPLINFRLKVTKLYAKSRRWGPKSGA